MKVLICGGRDFNNPDLLNDTLDKAHSERPFSLVIHGDYKGADYRAKAWAIARGIQEARFPANWFRLGKKAGPIRNAAMLLHGKPDLVIAFPGGDGTADMVARAKRAGVPVTEISA